MEKQSSIHIEVFCNGYKITPYPQNTRDVLVSRDEIFVAESFKSLCEILYAQLIDIKSVE